MFHIVYKMNSKRVHVFIPTFVSPHLFWIIESSKTLDRKDLETGLHDLMVSPVIEDPIIGEIVAVNDKEAWKRATVKEILGQTYKCWLIDYGTLHTTNTVYELPEKFKKLPPIVNQACLMNVVYLKVVCKLFSLCHTHYLIFSIFRSCTSNHCKWHT